MDDKQEIEEQKFKKILSDNKILPNKKHFVVVSLIIIIIMFILCLINIRDTKNVFYYSKDDIVLSLENRSIE